MRLFINFIIFSIFIFACLGVQLVLQDNMLSEFTIWIMEQDIEKRVAIIGASALYSSILISIATIIEENVLTKRALNDLNYLDRGHCAFSKLPLLNGDYKIIIDYNISLIKTNKHYQVMYRIIIQCLDHTKFEYKKMKWFKHFRLKLEHFKMINRFNYMLEIMIKYNKKSYNSWRTNK